MAVVDRVPKLRQWIYGIVYLVSTWVLASARKRFPLYFALAWAAGTLFFPLIVFPLYLIVMMVWRRRDLPPVKWRFVLPLLYAVIVLSSIGVWLYLDHRSIDAHLARATQAKLVEDKATAIREYQEALAFEDDPHTHKLLAIELAEAGDVSAAISEFRLAEQGGEPDDFIHFRLGLLLDRTDQKDQARLEFQKFLLSKTCQRVDSSCDAARQRIEDAAPQKSVL